jgi:predicted lactoylglutathione lyase
MAESPTSGSGGAGGLHRKECTWPSLAASREQVDAFHSAALEAGATDNGGPGVREIYHPDYYGAFVLDPDGNNVEAVCHTQA